jgi:hypothetical protein
VEDFLAMRRVFYGHFPLSAAVLTVALAHAQQSLAQGLPNMGQRITPPAPALSEDRDN